MSLRELRMMGDDVMKRKNMPARKERRRIVARKENASMPFTGEEMERLRIARQVKTKKHRGLGAKVGGERQRHRATP